MILQLEFRIPENWPPARQDEATAGVEVAWLLRGRQGAVIRAGNSPLERLPTAESCRMIVPASRVLLTRIQLPAQNRKKFMQALPYAVEDHIMTDPENVHVAAGPILENGEMPVVVVERAWLQKTLDLLQQAGLRPVAAEPETLLIPWQDGEWTVAWQGKAGFLRHGPHDGMTLDGGDEQQPPPGLRLALDGTPRAPGMIRVCCGEALAPDTDAWSGALGVPVSLAGEWQWPAPGSHAINLLQGAFSPRGADRAWIPRLRPAAILVAALIGAQILFTLFDWAMLKHEKRQLTARMEASFRSAFPDAKVIVDAPLQMSRNLADLRHRAGQPDQNDFLPLMAGIAPLLGESARLRKLNYQQGILNLHLTLPDHNAAEALRTRLTAIPRTLLESSGTTPDGVDIKMTIGIPQ